MVVDKILPLPFASCLRHVKVFLPGGKEKNIILVSNWTYYDMDADVILQRCETYHDKPDWIRLEPCIMSLSGELSAKR
ncbi:MAG: hypothetical protein KAT52_07340 [Desulfobacterales bacterium]|nr:hypothetical protein [Desulfobacterales bacterium]